MAFFQLGEHMYVVQYTLVGGAGDTLDPEMKLSLSEIRAKIPNKPFFIFRNFFKMKIL
jgi:hypothetical protein